MPGEDPPIGRAAVGSNTTHENQHDDHDQDDADDPDAAVSVAVAVAAETAAEAAKQEDDEDDDEYEADGHDLFPVAGPKRELTVLSLTLPLMERRRRSILSSMFRCPISRTGSAGVRSRRPDVMGAPNG